MTRKSREDRRGQIVVKPGLPREIAAMALFHAVSVAVCVGVPLYAMTRAAETLLAGRSPQLIALWDRWQFYLFMSVGVYVLVATAAWLLVTVWRSHRLAGPLVRMTAFVHGLAAGDYGSRIHLRDRDEIHALAEALNEVAESLERRSRGADAPGAEVAPVAPPERATHTPDGYDGVAAFVIGSRADSANSQD